ncbi:hypothetical protein RMSM_04710 [Rhodopirellula maiorica SM1]|uniref:Uncharacterized protein n=1 Tax=Rhodopirellula maiorica SM1 TaxID=1265738 RepID=M5RWQ8_9BACT|nr:hypothetical protein RMSM_04710 [Rhodopirellula maiorica SM1]
MICILDPDYRWAIATDRLVPSAKSVSITGGDRVVFAQTARLRYD